MISNTILSFELKFSKVTQFFYLAMHFLLYFCNMIRFPHFFINDNLSDFDLEEALPLLDQHRRDETLRYKNHTLQVQCAASWILLKDAMKHIFGIDDMPQIAFGKHGKPFFPELPNIHFNLSHCKNAVACAVSSHEVGIDIESVRHPLNDQLAQYVLTDTELVQVMSAKQPELVFTQFWTLKESIVKLTGNGIADDVKTVLERYAQRIVSSTIIDPKLQYVCTITSFKADFDK